MANVEVKTYGEGQVYLVEGAYTRKDLLGMLTFIEIAEERARELSESMKEDVESHVAD